MPRAGKATILPSSGSEGLPCGTILWGTKPDVVAGPAWGGGASRAAANPAKNKGRPGRGPERLLRLRNSCEKQGRERQWRRNAVNWNQDSHELRRRRRLNRPT